VALDIEAVAATAIDTAPHASNIETIARFEIFIVMIRLLEVGVSSVNRKRAASPPRAEKCPS